MSAPVAAATESQGGRRAKKLMPAGVQRLRNPSENSRPTLNAER
ncbi:hypothetical protein BURPS305_7135 [Burkholderia pseudomallei 305]|nr:hypothetical protein BURPS305_7135 [Burkholderia pseudomallei 305]